MKRGVGDGGAMSGGCSDTQVVTIDHETVPCDIHLPLTLLFHLHMFTLNGAYTPQYTSAVWLSV